MGKHSGKILDFEDREMSPLADETGFVKLSDEEFLERQRIADEKFATSADFDDGYQESDEERWNHLQQMSKQYEQPVNPKNNKYTSRRPNVYDDADYRKAAMTGYSNLTAERAAKLSDEELCRLYDEEMIARDLEPELD